MGLNNVVTDFIRLATVQLRKARGDMHARLAGGILSVASSLCLEDISDAPTVVKSVVMLLVLVAKAPAALAPACGLCRSGDKERGLDDTTRESRRAKVSVALDA